MIYLFSNSYLQGLQISPWRVCRRVYFKIYITAVCKSADIEKRCIWHDCIVGDISPTVFVDRLCIGSACDSQLTLLACFLLFFADKTGLKKQLPGFCGIIKKQITKNETLFYVFIILE